MILETPQQISIPQNTIKLFAQQDDEDFDAFIEAWRKNNSSNLHKFSSPRALLFGPCQTAYSTFVGFCHPDKNEIEKKGGLFGLFLTFSTQPYSPPFPILISPTEFNWLNEVSKISYECLSIFRTFLQRKSFCFVPINTSIFTPYTNTPSPSVVDLKVFSNNVFQTSKEKAEKKRFEIRSLQEQIDENIENTYQQLINEIRETT